MAIIIPEDWAHRPEFKWSSHTPEKLGCPYQLPGSCIVGFCSGSFDDWMVAYMRYQRGVDWDGVQRDSWYQSSWRDATWLDGIWFAAQAYGSDKIKSDIRTLFYARPVCGLDHETQRIYADYDFLVAGLSALLDTYEPEDRAFMCHIYCMLYYGMTAEYHKQATNCGGVIKAVAGMHMLDYSDAYVWGELRNQTYQKWLAADMARVKDRECRVYTVEDNAAFNERFLEKYDRAEGIAAEPVNMTTEAILIAGEQYGLYWDDPRNIRRAIAWEKLGRVSVQ